MRPALSYQAIKRFGDAIFAALLLVLCLAPMALLALAVIAESGLPALFRQARAGRGGRPFRIVKFRTLRPGRHDPDDPAAYVTRVGRFLRRWGLDELPQLWNVLRGEMSLVGPRPELPSVVARYEPWQHGRHVVKPGMTGLWQVSARAATAMHEATAIDLEYIERLSLRTDLSILARTIPALLTQRGK